MNDCKPFPGRAADYQNEALGRWVHYHDEVVPQFSWVVAMCDEPQCLVIKHLEIRHPIALDYPRWTCVYCGAPSDTRDHLMPVTWTGEAQRHSVFTVPACRECNSAIGDRHAMSITDRRRIAQIHIGKKYRRVLSRREFSDDELSEFDYGLRMEVISGMAEKRFIESRIAWPPLEYDQRAVDRSGVDAYQCGLIHA